MRMPANKIPGALWNKPRRGGNVSLINPDGSKEEIIMKCAVCGKDLSVLSLSHQIIACENIACDNTIPNPTRYADSKCPMSLEGVMSFDDYWNLCQDTVRISVMKAMMVEQNELDEDK